MDFYLNALLTLHLFIYLFETCNLIIDKIFRDFSFNFFFFLGLYLDLYDYRGYSPTWCLEKFSRKGGDQGLERSLGTCKPKLTVKN